MIQIEGLTHYYGRHAAVKDVSMHVPEGETFGFIGPNGAGKTTTMRALATLMTPTRGQLSVGGYDVFTQPLQVRRLIGYMPDFFGVYQDLKVYEYLDFYAAAYRIARPRRPAIVRDILDLTDLAGKADEYVDSLSRGMKQRLCLAKTLVHDPQYLILDEPASGLDPRARIEMRELLKTMRDMGKTIIISSHILTELSDFCTSVGIIESGELLACGPVEQIVRKLRAGNRYLVRVRHDLPGACQCVLQLPAVTSAEIHQDTLIIDGDERLPDAGDLVQALVAGGFIVTHIEGEQTDLEDVFMQITKGEVS